MTDLMKGLTLPVIAAPMFLTSGPDLVVEACNNGVLGTFPALNERSTEGFGAWLDQISARLNSDAAAYGVNLIVHKSNPRLRPDLDLVVRHKVPLVITSLGAVRDVVEAVHSYGGQVFHDVISRRHAEKAIEAGVDGLIAVSAGAGGHGGTYSPFAFVAELRRMFTGLIALAGAMSTGGDVLAARAMGADFAYMGTRFLATEEAMVSAAQKQMTRDARCDEVIYTDAISGVSANFLRASIVAAGLDPAALVSHGPLDMGSEAKAWKNVWSAGQGVSGITDIVPVAELCARLRREYAAALSGLGLS